jgi:hypothetical protein
MRLQKQLLPGLDHLNHLSHHFGYASVRTNRQFKLPATSEMTRKSEKDIFWFAVPRGRSRRKAAATTDTAGNTHQSPICAVDPR